MIGGNEMEQLMQLLKDFRDDVDFETCKDLVDGKVFDSFEILQLVDEIDDEFDVIIPAGEVVAENFNSAEAMYAMISRLQK